MKLNNPKYCNKCKFLRLNFKSPLGCYCHLGYFDDYVIKFPNSINRPQKCVTENGDE